MLLSEDSHLTRTSISKVAHLKAVGCSVMSERVDRVPTLPAGQGESNLAKAGAIAEIGSLVVGIISLPVYLVIAGRDVSISVLMVIVLVIGVLGVGAVYVGEVQTRGPNSKDINWLKIIEVYDHRMKIYIGTDPKFRYGVVLEHTLSEERRSA